jgi:hypothetical protein
MIVDFLSYKREREVFDDNFKLPSHNAESKENFLMHVKEHLIEEDYKEVLCGIMDRIIFEDLEEDLKAIVAEYFSIK